MLEYSSQPLEIIQEFQKLIQKFLIYLHLQLRTQKNLQNFKKMKNVLSNLLLLGIFSFFFTFSYAGGHSGCSCSCPTKDECCVSVEKCTACPTCKENKCCQGKDKCCKEGHKSSASASTKECSADANGKKDCCKSDAKASSKKGGKACCATEAKVEAEKK